MVIIVQEVTRFADTNAQGDKLFRALNNALLGSSELIVDFTGIQNATSSFVNSSFVRLLEMHSFSLIRDRIRIVGANKQIASLIRSRMYFEAAV